MQILKKPTAYMLEILGVLFKKSPWTSGEMHAKLIKLMPTNSPSRASVINFLNLLFDSGYVEYMEETCKGGSRRIYTLKGTKEDFLTKLQLEQLEQFLELWMEPLGAFN